MSKVEQHSSGTLKVKSRTTFIRYTQSPKKNNIHQVHSMSKVEQHSSYLMSVVLLLTECSWWMLFYFWLWVYLINVVLLWTLSVHDECCSTFDIECTWWMLFYFGLWVYLMNVVLPLTLSVPDECCSTFDIECTWWMLFYFWLWVYLMNVVLLLTLSVPGECCSTFVIVCICLKYKNIHQVHSKSKVEQHLSGTLNVNSRTTFIRYTQSPN
jgi:hypothetical protein